MSMGPTDEEIARRQAIYASLPPILQLIVGNPGGGLQVNPQAPGAMSDDGSDPATDTKPTETVRDARTFAAPPPMEKADPSIGRGVGVEAQIEDYNKGMGAAPPDPMGIPSGAAVGKAGIKPNENIMAAMTPDQRRGYFRNYGRSGYDLAEEELGARDARDYRLGRRTDEDGNFKKEGGKYSAVKNFFKGLGIGMLEGGAQGGIVGAITGGAVGAVGNTIKGGAPANAWGWKNYHEPGYQKRIAEEQAMEDRATKQQIDNQNLKKGDLGIRGAEQALEMGAEQLDILKEGRQATAADRELERRLKTVPKIQKIGGIEYFVDPMTGDIKMAGETTKMVINGEKRTVPLEWARQQQMETEKRQFEGNMKAAEMQLEVAIEIFKQNMGLISDTMKAQIAKDLEKMKIGTAKEKEEAEKRIMRYAWELENTDPEANQ